MPTKNYLDDIGHIRTLMEQSTRFLSLSGLSGVSVGIIAILSSSFGQYYLNLVQTFSADEKGRTFFYSPEKVYLFLGLATLLLALTSAVFTTARKSKKENKPLWNLAAKKLILDLSIPMISGGLFACLALYHHYYGLIVPSMLLFYGLALINCSKYTHGEIRQLGFVHIALGLFAFAIMKFHILIWGVGFGLFHVIYGLIMYKRYDS